MWMLWLYEWSFPYLFYFEYCFCFEFYIIELDCFYNCYFYNISFSLPPPFVLSFFSIDENLFNLLKSMPPFIYVGLSLLMLLLLLLVLSLSFRKLLSLLLLPLLLFNNTFCMNPLVSILMLFDDMDEDFWLCRYNLSDYVDWLLLFFIPLLLLLLLLDDILLLLLVVGLLLRLFNKLNLLSLLLLSFLL